MQQLKREAAADLSECLRIALGHVIKEGKARRVEYHSHLVASALSLRIAGPATALSHNDISLLVGGRPRCAGHSLGSPVLVLAVGPSSYCHPDRHAKLRQFCDKLLHGTASGGTS